MNIEVFNTHIELSPYVAGDLPSLEALYTATDTHTQTEFPCGYILEEGKLYVPRGTPIGRLELWRGEQVVYNRDSDPEDDMSREHIALYPLRDEIQVESCHFLTSHPNHQLALNLVTGFGKTFVTASAICKLGKKALIITHTDGLKTQWMVNTFLNMFDFMKSEIRNIDSSAAMEAIVDGLQQPADVYFINHQTLRSYLTSKGIFAFQQFFKKLKIGIKVYDESHLEFANILMVDSFSNTNRTWYLTATFDRSNKSESKCFQRAFSSLSAYGEEESKKLVEKHIVYHVCNYNSRPAWAHTKNVVRFNGMSAATYGKYAFFDDPNQSAYTIFKLLLEKMQDIEGKILIFVPLIDAVDEVAKKIKQDFPDKTVGRYHSKTDADEKRSAINKDIIVSTIKSCGTGKDIPGLRVLICAEPIASRVQTQQLLGRLRPFIDKEGNKKDTYFFDLVDRGFQPMSWWFNARFKKVEELAKTVINLDLNS